MHAYITLEIAGAQSMHIELDHDHLIRHVEQRVLLLLHLDPLDDFHLDCYHLSGKVQSKGLLCGLRFDCMLDGLDYLMKERSTCGTGDLHDDDERL